ADVPVGVLWSGGLDSSLIVALLAAQGQNDLRTFSVGFETIGELQGDEFHYSDLIAQRFATRHERIAVDTSPRIHAPRSHRRHHLAGDRRVAGDDRGDVRANDEPRRDRLLSAVAASRQARES